MNFTMFRFSTTALMLSACQVASFSLNAGLATADDVAIAISSDEKTVRVSIDEELFAVVQRSERWKKPFIYPVLRPGWSSESFEAGHGIVVADSPVLNREGTPTGTVAKSITRVAALQKVGDLLEVPDLGGFLTAADVVPESALVVRTIEESPMPYQRKNKKAYDHPHHKGIWISVDEVNGVKYWNEDGIIRPESVSVVDGSNLQLINSWLGEDGQPVVKESTVYRFSPNRLIVANITFENVIGSDVTFEDTKEGLFGARIASELRERETGKISDAAGRVDEKNVWGHENRWVDYTGEKAGQTMGITLFDHPQNPQPARYHVRGYGLFAINPFGQHAYSRNEQPTNHLVLKPGDSASFTYGLWVHGSTDSADLAAVEKQVIGSGSK